MLKHVVKHNQKRAVLLFREVPEETHMCLITYSDMLPSMFHDSIMKVLESEIGQQAENFADALFRNIMADGRNTLEALHKDGHIQKVPTNQVVVQANARSTVRLDELNSILNEMAQGEEAIKRLAELDAGAGLGNGTGVKRRPVVREGREVGMPPNSLAQPVAPSSPEAIAASVLTDADLAHQRIAQAEKMRASAAQLLAEAERLSKEAADLNPGLKVNVKKTKVKAN
jgi:hypothetical protein